MVFLADCISSRETLDKYAVSFIYDVGAYLETLDKVERMGAAMFVPAHARIPGNCRLNFGTVCCSGREYKRNPLRGIPICQKKWTIRRKYAGRRYGFIPYAAVLVPLYQLCAALRGITRAVWI